MPKDIEYKGGFIQDQTNEKEKNWVFGGVEDVWEVINQSGDWGIYRSNPEKQAKRTFDPYSCVSVSLTGNVEKVLNKMMIEDPSITPVLEELGMLGEDSKADISERFVAEGSGTIAGRGNSQHRVYEFVRKNGLVGEKMWPSVYDMSEDEFYKMLPADIKALGKKFLEYFTFEYKDVGESNDDLKEALKRSPLCVVVGGAYLGEENGALLYRNNGTPSYNHQLQNYRQDRNVSDFNQVIPVVHKIEDSYEPFLKDYAPNYPFAFAKIIKINFKKKSMFKLIKTADSPAVYLLVVGSGNLYAISDSEEVKGGDVLKTFSGTYKNAGIEIVPSIDQTKIVGEIKAIKF